MQRSAQGYIPVSGHLQRQLAAMPEFHRPEMPAFTIHEYQPLIDSSDMTPQDWQAIAEDIRQNYDLYDGFVILHGTDTMAFTASALSLCWKTGEAGHCDRVTDPARRAALRRSAKPA